MELKTDLPNREAITKHLTEMLKGLYSTDAIASEIDGSREAALEELSSFTARGYGRRNFVDAPTSRLSAYLRHGQLSVTEVAAHVKGHATGRERDEFLKQLTWHEFFYLVMEQEGAGTLQNLEPPKYAVRWQAELPDDIRNGETGLPCVDAWVTRLVTDNYLHNHERLWFAAYVTHFRRVDWKAGWDFFREHLLDGDIASNGLSWQWVASTFSNKPYFMNQENIAKYSDHRWCATCHAPCPFRQSYETLERELFGSSHGWTS